MGNSPWSTPIKLYEEKICLEINESNSFIMDKGNEFEPRVRSLFEMQEGESFSPALVQMEKYPFIRASLDGQSTDGKKLIEIKLSSKEDWDLANDKKQLPKKYIDQVQHQLMVTNAEKCFYLSYLYEKGAISVESSKLAIVEVFPDTQYQMRLLAEEVAFWNFVTTKNPPPLTDKDYRSLVYEGAKLHATKWKELKNKISELENELEAVQTAMLDQAKSKKESRFTCHGIRIQQISRIGNVEYKKIPELKTVDLEKYRGKGSVSWRVEEIKEKKVL